MGFGRGGKERAVGALGAAGGLQPEATVLKSGKVAVTWINNAVPTGEDATTDTLFSLVAARLLKPGGAPAGEVFEVNRTPEDQQLAPSIEALTGGGFILAWHNNLSGGDAEAQAQVLSAAGRRVGPELTPASTSEDSQSRPQAAALADGGAMLVWEDDRDPLGEIESDLYLREVNARGKFVGKERLLADGGGITPDIAELKNGKLAVVADDLANVVVRLVSPAGKTLRKTSLGDSVDQPQVAALKGGGFVVAWLEGGRVRDNGSPEGQDTIAAQLFDARGKAVGGTIGVPRDGAETTAGFFDLTSLKSGGFALAWQQSGGAGDPLSIHAAAFTAKGARDGREIQANKTESGPQYDPFIVQTRADKVMIGWVDQSFLFGGAASEIVTRVFDLGGGGRAKAGLASEIDAAAGPGEGGAVASAAGSAAPGDGGSNTVFLRGGDDVWSGRGGADTAYGGSGDDLIHGGAGRDALTGGRGGDGLYGDGGRDLLHGGQGADRLYGGAGDDTLYGDAGRDWLEGGGGDDILFGGGGRDRFGVVADGTSNTVFVTDFEAGTDRLVVRGAEGPVRPADVTVQEVGDGTSNTLLFGEVICRFDTERGDAAGFDDLIFA